MNAMLRKFSPLHPAFRSKAKCVMQIFKLSKLMFNFITCAPSFQVNNLYKLGSRLVLLPGHTSPHPKPSARHFQRVLYLVLSALLIKQIV